MKVRYIVGSMVLTALSISACVQAQGEREARGGPHGEMRPPPPPGAGPGPVMDALDPNHDHVISVEELQNAVAALKRLDRNGDGQLTEEELRPRPARRDERGGEPEGNEARGPRGGGERDLGRDFEARRPPEAQGRLRPDDREARGPQGGPREDEFRGPPRPGPGGPGGPGGPPPMLMALDADRDGEVSIEEMSNASNALKKLDRNGDGKLTREELRPPRPSDGEQSGRSEEGERADRPRGERGDHPPGPRAQERRGPGASGSGERPESGERSGPPRGREGDTPGEGRGHGPERRPPPPVIDTLDANHDGELSADELSGSAAALKKLDKDGDGKLSVEEMRPTPPPRDRDHAP